MKRSKANSSLEQRKTVKNSPMKKIQVRLNLDKIALVSCTIAAILLAIEMIAVTVYKVENAFFISSLVAMMTISIGVCLSVVLLQWYLENMDQEQS